MATFALGPCGLASPIGDYEFEDGIDQATGGAAGGETPIFTDAQIYGHTAAAGVVSVGASFFREIDTGGDIQPPPAPQIDVEPFSSRGGDLPFFFDGSGMPIPPETRFKPDITTPDGTNNTFFGDDIDDFFEPPRDSFPNFFGTSAAAPHAAAVAALMKDQGNLSPSGLKQVIEQSTFDLGLPDPEFDSGFGLLDALNGVGITHPDSPDCLCR